MPDLDDLLKRDTALPALPQIYIEVSQLLDDPDSSAEEIGAAVQMEPSITSRILKMVNSAYYGLNRPVSSITQTVAMIGTARLKQILFGSILAGLFKPPGATPLKVEEFWRHSVMTAIIARHLAMQNARIIDHDELFTAGLLHDIGRLIIAIQMPSAFNEIQRLITEQQVETLEAEKRVLGFDHTLVSEALLQSWGLPRLLVHCVRQHHNTEHGGALEIPGSIIYLANRLSQLEKPLKEDEAEKLVREIPAWEKTRCTIEQIGVGWGLAEDQAYEVMIAYGLIDDDSPI